MIARAPCLVDEDLGEDHLRIFAGDQAIELAIEPVRRGAVDEEAEAGQPEEAVPASIGSKALNQRRVRPT